MKSTFVIFAILLLLPSFALAHGMKVDCVINATTVQVTAKYDDDEPIFPGTVRILNAAGEEIAKAATNEQGVAELSRPAPGTYKIRADDGGAHARTKTVEIPDDTITASSPDDSRNRWLMIALGLGIIAAFCLILRWFQRRKRPV